MHYPQTIRRSVHRTAIGIGAAFLAFANSACAQASAVAQSASRASLRILVLVPDNGGLRDKARRTEIANGMRLGAAESARAAKLVGKLIDFALQTSPPDSAVFIATGTMHELKADVVVGGVSERECEGLASLAAKWRVVYVNSHCSGDDLRTLTFAACEKSQRRHDIHVAPSVALRNAALQSVPDSLRARGAIQAWHPTLNRFGAGEINARYQQAYGSGMTSDAWLGWAAVKIVVDIALRAKSQVMTIALSEPLRLDAHKGRSLRIREPDGQVLQPLYLIGPASANAPTGVLLYEVGTVAGSAPPMEAATGRLRTSCE